MMDNKITGSFILLALFMADGINDTLSSEVRKIISKNYIVKLLIVYMLTFFTINFTASKSDILIDHLIDSSIIFVIFVLSIKSHTYIFVVVCSLIIINHIVNTHVKYLDDLNEKNENEYNNYLWLSRLIPFSIVGISVAGFLYKIYTMRNGRRSIINYLLTDH